MPVYQYEGLHYELPDGLTNEQAISKIETHLGKGKKAGLGTAVASSFAGVGNTADNALSMLVGGAASLFGQTEDADKIFSKMDARNKERDQWANPNSLPLSTGGKIAGAVATLPMQVLTAPLSPFTTGKTAIDAGESLEDAGFALGIDTLGNMAGFALGPGKTLAGTVAKNAGANAAQDYATKWAIQQALQTEQGKKAFEPSLEDAGVAALVGGATAGAMHRSPKKALPKVDSHVDAIIKEKVPVDPNLELYKQAALEKEQQAIAKQQAEGQKPIFVNKEGEAAKNLNDLEIQNQTSQEGFGKQQSLFDQHEETVGRPNQFNAEPNPAGWRVDENGIPIRADLSMEAANLENPLQRNLFGDELGPALDQTKSLTEAIDSIPDTPFKGDAREVALSRLQGEIPAPGQLEAAKLAAESTKTPEGKVPFNFKRQGGGIMKFGDKEKVDFLKDTPLGKRLGDVGHAMIKSADEAVKLAKDVKDVSQNVVQQGFNYLTKGGTYLKGRLDHPVVHYTIDRMLEGHDVGKSLVQQHLHADYLPALRDLSKQERTNVFTMLNHADLTQTLLTKERMDAAGVPPREQTFILKHQALMAETLKQINSARVAVGKKPITAREAYSAMNMSGIHRKVVYKMLPNAEGVPTRQVVGVIGADTLHVGKHSLNNLEKMLKEKDPALEFGAHVNVSEGQHPTRGTPHEAFLDVLKTIGENDPKYADFLNTLREVAKDDPSNFLGMQKHTLQKKGVWGMEGRKSWLSPEENAKQFFENQVKYAESALSWGPLAEAAMDVNKVLRDESVVSKHKNAVGISEAYMQNALGLNPNKLGRAVVNGINVLNTWSGNTLKPGLEMTRQAANTMMMSLSPSFLALQLIQPMAASPAMAMFLKGRGMEGSFSTGVVKAFNTNLKVFQDKPLSAFEKDMFKYMEDRHVASADMIEKSNQIEKNAAYWTNRITQHPGAVVESVTRKQVFMSLSHMLKDSGLTKETGLFEQAQRFTDMAMNNMAQLEKPAFYHALGPLGSMAYNLKSFSHNELSRLSLYAREMAETGNAAPLLTQLATTIALAGVMGLPFYSQFESLYDFITEKMGKPKSLTMDIIKLSEELGKETNLGKKGLYLLSHGGLSAAGVDVSKRVGLGDVLPSHASDAAFAGGSKVIDMAKSAAMLATHPTDPDYQRYAAQTLAPPFLQGPLDIAFSPEGQALKKDPTKKPDLMAKRTEGDITAKKMGLIGINESVTRQKTYQNDRIDRAFKDIANSAMVSIYQDIRHGRPIRPEMVEKFIKVGQGDPQMMEKNIQSFAENMNLTVAEQRLLRDSMSKRIPQLRSLERRTQ